MLPTYLFIYHLVSSAVPSFPNLFLQLVITVFLQFSKVFPTCWCMLSFDFISFSHPFWENMERSTIFHGKIWKDPQCFMGKYGKIHHFPWEKEHMERSTIFHGKIWTDPPFFMGNSFTCQGLPGLPGLLVALGPSDTELIPTLNKFIPFQW